ncbi:MurR/RpiR family transcriptional regulator [Clostridium perfringens]|uniref:MurR/RpiR family transcriptional regulator n=1 Tax=Clostridium perfringens TaxID=1502 RepID=A0A8H9QZ46_CLOPF|nr:MurR/RpiR family transcriptional regulator [Clostridium perfringens]EGT3600858.1 MurR/RpiR family transcriptional regulator [Clostridium perfringens]MBI5992659.1 MurR/RpiR family transcriptional regulator [Clostridium perfringens]MCH1961525.1 MurR/RpiR family transcriptional regulator [Clostridium perfringens]MDK0539245.1 MurR/RpiR family transcriptional regulator [Clostridium perfringens]MDK0565953.1 MurR/RpiR family transcriptional regulator [Clostridium perfringens]
MRLEELVNKHYDKLNHSDLYIWKYIFNHKKDCCNLTIDELANRCNVSRTTILRFAQKLSLKGYSELKIYLKWESEDKEFNEKDYLKVVCNDITKFISDMQEKDFSSVCNLMYNAKRIFVYGTGAVQSSVAAELKRIFLSGQECIYNIQGEAEADMILNTISDEDLIFLISLTGESDHIKRLAKQFKLRNVPIISITKLKNNTLARLSDENLYINTSMHELGGGKTYESTTLFFTLAEMIFLKYSMYKNELEKEDKN